MAQRRSKMAAGAHDGSLQQLLHDHDDVEVEDDVDACSREELARRPEVKFINRYAVLRTYVLMGLKGSGALVVLWATVVLLGGFVSKLETKDFWYITFIAFVQAGGMFNGIFDNELGPLMSLFLSTMKRAILPASRVKHSHVETQLLQTSWSWWLRTKIRSLTSRVAHLIVSLVLYLVLSFFIYSPLFCAFLANLRIGELDYGRSNKDDSEANLRPGISLFYFLCLAQGIMFMFIVWPIETYGTLIVVDMVSRQVGLSRKVVLGYCGETKMKYLKSLESIDGSWNLITYGAGLLDSEMPEDYASGARVLTTLIQQGVPVRQLLLQSPRLRIQKLVATLAWRSPADGERRWLAARIVEHVAPDLSLAQFPGALECISSLLDTSGYNKDDGAQEAIYFAAQLRLDKQSEQKKRISLVSRLWKRIKHLALRNGNAEEKEQVISIDSAKGTNEDLILQGLRILENLAVDELNCKVICSSDVLFSKITAPLSSENLVLEDMETNTAWAKVIDGSLKLVSRLMKSPGDTGKEMRRRVAHNSSAVKNLENFLAQKINSCNIIVLQIRAIDILEQLCWGDESTSNNLARERREYLIPKVQDIVLTDKWMKDYLSETRAKLDKEIENQLEKSHKSKKSQHKARQALVENKMKAAQETVSHLKEKAGEALATLCVGNQIHADDIRSITSTGPEGVLCYLTEMLDSNKPEGSTVRSRISAAVILKHLCTHCTTSPSDQDHIKKITLEKVLRELLHIKAEAPATSTSKLIQWWQQTISQGGHDERLRVQGHKQQHEERRLQVALLLLCAAIRGRWIIAPEFATVVAQLATPKVLAEKLKELVDENRYATPSCRATVKLSCELVIALIPYDHCAEDVEMKKVIVDSLYQASKAMAGLESCMLFSGAERDCYGIPVRPFCSDLVKKAQELLEQKGQALGLNVV